MNSPQGAVGRWGAGFGPNDVPLNERLDELTHALESLEASQELESCLNGVASALTGIIDNKHSDEDTRRSAVVIRAFIYSIDGHPYWASHQVEKTDACVDAIVGHAHAAHQRAENRKAEAAAKREAQIAEAVAGVVSLTLDQAKAVVSICDDEYGPGFDEAVAIVIGAIQEK